MKKVESANYEFGPFRLEVRTNRLLRGEEVIPTGRKPLEILKLLLENAGELVEKEEILRRVWPNQVIEDNNLTQNIYNLRRLLGDTTKGQNWIQTIPGRGYVFLEEVKYSGAETSDAPTQSDLTEAVSVIEPRRPVGMDQNVGTAHPHSSATRWKIASGLMLCFVLTAGAFIIFRTTIGRSITGRFVKRRLFGTQSNLPRVIPFVTLPGQESYPAFSPDGKYLAFTSEGETRDNQDIYLKEIRGGQMSQLRRITTDPDNDHNVTWSPDGKRLAFLRKPPKFSPYRVIIVPTEGSREEVIGQSWGGLDWSPSGDFLATSDYEGLGTPTGIYLIPVNGGEKKKLTTPPQNIYDTFPKFSPDGKHVAFVRWISNTNSDLFILSLADGALRQITFDQRRIPDLHWSSDSADIYFSSDRESGNRLWRVTSTGGTPVLIPGLPIDLETFSISRDGELLACTQQLNDTVIELNDIQPKSVGDNRQTNPLCSINSSRGDDTPRFSPDGSKIAFTSDRSGSEEIWVAKANCTDPVQITHFSQIGVGSPRWSPDGQRIAFDRNTENGPDIYTIGIDGNSLKRLTNDPVTNNMPAWSHDGEWIYYTSSRNNIRQIFKIPANGGDSIQVTKGRGHEPIESADGTTLYYNNEDSIWQKDLRTGTESVIPELADIPIGRYWEVAGDEIFFIPQATGVDPTVIRFDLRTRLRQPVLQIRGFLAKWVPGLSYDAVRKRLAVSYVSYRLGDITLLEDWQ